MRQRVIPCILSAALIANCGAAYGRGFGGRGFGGSFGRMGSSFGGGFGHMGSSFGGGFGRNFGGMERNFGGGFGRTGGRFGGGSGVHPTPGGRFGQGGRFGGGSGLHPTPGGFGNHGYGFGRISGNSIGQGHNLHNFSNNYMNNRGAVVRNNFNHYNAFIGTGYHGYYHGFWGYPGAWMCPGWGMGAAWMITSWSTLALMLGMEATMKPRYYGYGQNVTYNNNQVYYNGTPYASAGEYYNQAQTLAGSAPVGKPSKKGKWKPLGVFSMVEGSQSNSTMLFQLAINKDGDIGGNYYDMLSDQVQQVHGKLDKKTQRVAWTIGNNKKVVYDTGLGNLLKEQAPLLVHFDKNRTQEWLLIRLKKPKGVKDSSPGGPNSPLQGGSGNKASLPPDSTAKPSSGA